MRSTIKSFLLVGIGVAGVLAIGLGYRAASFLSYPGTTGPSKTVFYEVKVLSRPANVTRDLEQLGVISNARLFYWYGRITGKLAKFRAGDYRFTTAMRPDEVMNIILSGISHGIPLTVPEGFSYTQISELVEATHPGMGTRFKELCVDKKFIASLGFVPAPESLEGYLFPDTYLIGRQTPPEDVVRQMVRKYKGIFTPELARRAHEIGFSEHQAVTLASIVEKETGAKQERPLISSVFHNRLKKKMRLQTDPTVIYGIKNYRGNITRKDLETFTPYNTYKIAGLPPGPIANPGKEAIYAALYPAESAYLYFVSHNDGTHEFTSTYEDHQKAVRQFQIDPKAREGKSWRDMNKKPNVSAH
jgi:UPF0755 protein